jgi:DNA modification methylase
MAGSVVLDPFAGSHATLEACLDLSMYPITCELSVESYSLAKTRIHNYFKTKGE